MEQFQCLISGGILKCFCLYDMFSLDKMKCDFSPCHALKIHAFKTFQIYGSLTQRCGLLSFIACIGKTFKLAAFALSE